MFVLFRCVFLGLGVSRSLVPSSFGMVSSDNFF